MATLLDAVEPGELDLPAWEGGVFEFLLRFWTDSTKTQRLSLADWDFRMDVRKERNPSSTRLLRLTVGSGLTVDAANGEILGRMTPTEMAAVDFGDIPFAHYDLFGIPPDGQGGYDEDKARPVIRGVIPLHRTVTTKT